MQTKPSSVTLPAQLTGAQLRDALKAPVPACVHLLYYTGKIVRGYSDTRSFYFADKTQALAYASAMGFEHFNLYGRAGSPVWSSDHLAA